MSTIDIARSPSQHYRDRRDAGSDHETAVREVQHAYGRRDLGERLERVRAAYETPEAAVETPAEIVAEQHPLDAVEAEVAERIAGLSEQRAGLSLDALTDNGKRRELDAVEAELASARAELERVGLARTESTRRDDAEREQAEQLQRDDALQRAEELGAAAAKAWGKVEAQAASFAAALAEHNRLCMEQGAARSAAGDGPEAWRQTCPAAYTLAGMFKGAIAAAGAPSGWWD